MDSTLRVLRKAFGVFDDEVPLTNFEELDRVVIAKRDCYVLAAGLINESFVRVLRIFFKLSADHTTIVIHE